MDWRDRSAFGMAYLRRVVKTAEGFDVPAEDCSGWISHPPERAPAELDAQDPPFCSSAVAREAGRQRVQIWGFCAGLPRAEPAAGWARPCPGCLSRGPGVAWTADGITLRPGGYAGECL